MQSQTLTVLMKALGSSKVSEEIFEGRFKIVDELKKFGANIEVKDSIATVYGVSHLKGNEVYATELRGGAALVIAGLMADGITKVYNPEHIERGYEDICRDFRQLGAEIYYVE